MFRKLMFAAVAVASALVAGVAVAAPPPEAFGALPAVRTVRVSPSGKYFAIIQNLPGQSAVKTFDSASGQMLGGIGAAKQQTIVDVAWQSDDRVLVFVVEVEKISENIVREDEIKGTNVCRIMSIGRDGKNPVQLKIGGMLKDATFTCTLIGSRTSEPNTVLLAGSVINSSGLNSKSQVRADVRVFKVNVLTGEAELSGEQGSRSTVGWAADPSGEVRLRYDIVAGEEVLYARLAGSASWEQVHRQPWLSFESSVDTVGSKAGTMDVIGFAQDPNQLYVSYWPGDLQALGLFDLRTHQITNAFSDPKFDVAGAVSLARKIVGARVSRALQDQIFFTDEIRKIQATLAGNFPGHHVTISHASDDLGKLAVYAEGQKWPGGAYLLFDTKANEITLVSALYPSIDLASTGEQKFITYNARDGKPIDAFLTVPRTGGKNLPAIILPHGGPEAQDDGGFDWLSQFFASRGYVVLQPQYRGSTGRGTNFALAGRKQWGLKMQDDLSDGVKYLTSNGIADASKICIMGWSYGGYAAMAGATLTPELYRCSIAGAGVSDLGDMLQWSSKYGGGSIRYWRLNIGDPTADKAKIDAASPALHVNNVRGPMLLIHGELDSVVPIRQSEIMANAMKAAGKPYEFVRLPNENHNITFASTRIATLKAMDEFLAKHNPAR